MLTYARTSCQETHKVQSRKMPERFITGSKVMHDWPTSSFCRTRQSQEEEVSSRIMYYDLPSAVVCNISLDGSMRRRHSNVVTCLDESIATAASRLSPRDQKYYLPSHQYMTQPVCIQCVCVCVCGWCACNFYWLSKARAMWSLLTSGRRPCLISPRRQGCFRSRRQSPVPT